VLFTVVAVKEEDVLQYFVRTIMFNFEYTKIQFWNNRFKIVGMI